MVGGSLWLLPPPKLVAMILLKVALNTKYQSIKPEVCHTYIHCTQVETLCRLDITEILLKVALNTLTPETLCLVCMCLHVHILVTNSLKFLL
jgi:hypothetical protein